jgi:hypothetical protein
MLDLGGFSAESTALIREYESHGWTFRVSSKGHAIGKAPDGAETTSIGRQLSPANRSQQNAEAPLRRWLKAREQAEQPPSLAVLAKPVLSLMEFSFHPSRVAMVAGAVALGWQPEQMVNGSVRLVRSGAKPIVVRKSDKVLSKQEYRSMNERVRDGGDPMRVRMAAGMTQEEWIRFVMDEMEAADITLKVAVAPLVEDEPTPEPATRAGGDVALEYRPWKAKGSGGLYDSKAVLEQVLDGEVVAYLCAVCREFESFDDPHSVAAHARSHTRGKGTQPRNPVTEKDSDSYTPTARLVEALAAFIDAHGWEGMSPEEIATTALTWMATRPDLPPPSPREPLTDTQIVERIRALVRVSSVDEFEHAEALATVEAQVVAMDRLRGEIAALARQVESVTAERDRLQSDLDAWLSLAPKPK